MNQLQNIERALACGRRSNLRINGESMTYPPKPVGEMSIVERVSTQIELTTQPYNQDMLNLFKYPYCATDYNEYSPYSIY